jgi:transposase
MGEYLGEFLWEDQRSKISNTAGVLVAVKNYLMSREPIYGIGDWAEQHAPELLGIPAGQASALNDDRLGRCLDRLFDAEGPSVVLAITTHVVKEFRVSLDELHNDSTTVTFSGEYKGATDAKKVRGKPTPAITWGHNKDHRPDMKQILYTLTVSADGAVPVNYDVGNGNLTDDQTHRETWDFLCQLTGTVGFLYVADSKVATKENMAYIDRSGGRFLSVLPQTRAEDKAFRQLLAQQGLEWVEIHQKEDEDGRVIDQISTTRQSFTTAEGYRLLWFHSSRKQELDQAARSRRIQRTLLSLTELRKKLASPRTRYREKSRVLKEIDKRLQEHDAGSLILVEIHEIPDEKYRQAGPGRPGKGTRYLRQVKSRFDIVWKVDAARMAAEALYDGVFPLVTNDKKLTIKELLLAYKRQSLIEKRFAQLKTNFQVAPVFLKSVSRIKALLCVYFLALLVQALLERELRLAMAAEGIESLPIYPEGRPCRFPTTRQIIDLFENVQRHELVGTDGSTTRFAPELSRLQKEVLRLLKIELADYRG